jgi:hypothetical protein
MGVITPEGKLYLIVQERTYRGQDVVRFLKHLLRYIAGKLLVIWDVVLRFAIFLAAKVC